MLIIYPVIKNILLSPGLSNEFSGKRKYVNSIPKIAMPDWITLVKTIDLNPEVKTKKTSRYKRNVGMDK